MPGAFAWRWLAYHLVGAGRHERLRELLLDFSWLRAKLEATDSNTLLTAHRHGAARLLLDPPPAGATARRPAR